MVPSRKRKKKLKKKKKNLFPSLLSCQLFCLSLTVSLSIRLSASLSLLQILGLPLINVLEPLSPVLRGDELEKREPSPPNLFLKKTSLSLSSLSLSTHTHTHTHSSDVQMFPTVRPSAEKAQALRGSGQGPRDAES